MVSRARKAVNETREPSRYAARRQRRQVVREYADPSRQYIRYMSFHLKPLRSLAMVALLLVFNQRALAKEGYGELSAVLNTTALQPGKEAVIAVVFDVKQGFHTQSHTPSDKDYIAFEVKLDDNTAFTAQEPIYPEGENHTYPQLGALNVYTGRAIVYIPIQVKSDAKPDDLKITARVTHQACDDNQWFRPQSPKFELPTKIVSSAARSAPTQP